MAIYAKKHSVDSIIADVVILPSFGTDTLLVFRWKVVGWVVDYLGEG